MRSGLSAATTRKAVFALRQCLAAAIADNRLQFNPATAVPLPTERQKAARYLSQPEVERLVEEMRRQYRALVLVGAYAGLRWREAVGLRRRDIDPLRPRIHVVPTAVEVRGRVTLDNEPKTTRSKRSVLWLAASCTDSRNTSSNSLTAAQTPWCSPRPEADHSSECRGAGCCDRRQFVQTWTTSPSTGSGGRRPQEVGGVEAGPG